ncbi:DUF3488 and transglutaminase-like domain-containing protein [Undibacterium sp. RTI2.1]|uniref:transglutaminase family protein n=1 Tax=unclassified Undibacterium TaxID=2630295 RepID=UPI002AB36A5B|nr:MULTISPECIES: DUF3488 and transglutaminase-like domain-containing protein [unclassified Undibacterium]MDY7538727.1 DUF3488 and transglutaminase-like domain-containing protein [Undibacterium sp. 5I1]MEB0030217.1 DUF3488 and transglutaminase-like domain-containing protein [Undibacterium sp. RTI2.1]MEB0116841.1 DUF3488 and transglutaminase-like domain-containing protein [Undibacterium sp. RTI2.2]MEB0229666.1 DUF3488 and transglutaminase-like domain-containing protein [Undibacterium sp. 10I3]ME
MTISAPLPDLPDSKIKSGAKAISTLHKSWRKLPLARDKADTLLLIFACLLVLLPHISQAERWVSVSCLCLLAWRGWLTLTGRRMPPSWVLVPIASLMMGGVFLHFHTFFGRDAGVTMLMMLLACKLLEMHAKRDLFVVLYLSFFLLLTQFLDTQTIGSAAFALCAVIALLTAQLSFNYTGVVPPLMQRIKLGLLILALAIPLTIVAFYLFPRLQGPLWSLPSDANTGRSGLSDSMTPGNISKLALSEDIAFRVKFPDLAINTAPQKSLLYWRGIVLSHFDGSSWTHAESPKYRSRDNTISFSGAKIRQEIIMESQGQRWLFGLDLPNESASINDLGSSLNTQGELSATQAINRRMRYEVTSQPQYRWQPELSLRDLQTEVALPAGFNPRTLAFAADLRQRASDDKSLIQAVLHFFRTEKFSYTLEPPLLGKNSVDDFLFNSRAGFCEHYASAFVVLMRAVDIPARVVTGYQGGEMNLVDGFMEVRQSDAHAWAEVWLQDQGWVRVDPTAAVAPERINLNLSSILNRRGFSEFMNLGAESKSLLSRMRMQLDAVNNSWNQWVLNYNPAKQVDFLRTLGLGELDWPKLMLVFFAIGTVLIGLIALPLLYHRPKLAPLDKLYFSLCKKLADKKYPRLLHEGPTAYTSRLKSKLPEALFIPVQSFLALYAATKYGDSKQPMSSVLAQLKTLLAQCR